MIRHWGFACELRNEDDNGTNYKHMKADNVSMKRWKESIFWNIDQTVEILHWCKTRGVKMVRLSSKIIPLAERPDIILKRNYIWQKISDRLLNIGKLIKDYNVKTSIHSQRFTIINSPEIEIVNDSIRDIVYNYSLLKNMGLESFGIIINIGGVYGNKDNSKERFIRNWNKIPKEIRNHIRLENDSKYWNIEDVLTICEELEIPMILDYHSHICNNDGETLTKYRLERILATWDIVSEIPEVHLSSPNQPERPQIYSDYINIEYVGLFLRLLEGSTREIDIMVEAKAKNLAMIRIQTEWMAKMYGFVL